MGFKDIEKGNNFVVVGAGSTLSIYKDNILSFIKKNKALTLGINRMTGTIVPTYHLWTNRKRWGKYGSCVNNDSKLILGPSITSKHAKKHYRGKYDRIDYVDKEGTPFEFKDEQICGYFRTAGVLAIALAHTMGAKNIFIVGMDGYTFHDKKALKRKKANHHCYGSGYTDDASWDDCIKKDNIVYDNLKTLSNNGIKFSILTPTVFDKFYENKMEI
jgi:hypothetical protein